VTARIESSVPNRVLAKLHAASQAVMEQCFLLWIGDCNGYTLNSSQIPHLFKRRSGSSPVGPLVTVNWRPKLAAPAGAISINGLEHR
jgi:hypothetical protein